MVWGSLRRGSWVQGNDIGVSCCQRQNAPTTAADQQRWMRGLGRTWEYREFGHIVEAALMANGVLSPKAFDQGECLGQTINADSGAIEGNAGRLVFGT